MGNSLFATLGVRMVVTPAMVFVPHFVALYVVEIILATIILYSMQSQNTPHHFHTYGSIWSTVALAYDTTPPDFTGGGCSLFKGCAAFSSIYSLAE
jgi:hypothetical protein